MKLNCSNVEFSHNDLRQGIRVPQELTDDLAYLMGVHLGDGHLGIHRSGNGVSYLVCYSGHAIDELGFHQEVIAPLLKRLFNKAPPTRIERRTSLRTAFCSKAVLTFMTQVVGLPLGPKDSADIPQLIKEGGFFQKVAFLRGIADTEFSLTFKKKYKDTHYYPVIEYATSCKALALSLKQMLAGFGLNACYFSYLSRRYEKKHVTHQLTINGKKALEKWMDTIGFSSEKHLTKYGVWKREGFLPPYTTLPQRKAMLRQL